MREEQGIATLLQVIERLPVTTEPAPAEVDSFWVDSVRGSLRGWATELLRDMSRIDSGLAQAARAGDGAPEDDQIAALEEAFRRLHSAAEKVDAIVTIAFGLGGVRLYDARARSLRFDADERANSIRLRDLGTPDSLRFREARGRLEGERAILRRHQLVHSLVPIVGLHDLATYVLVHHRDGRIIPGGYELGFLGPERWDEGVKALLPELLFARRLEEAIRARERLGDLVGALAGALASDARIEVPPLVYLDHDTGELALERPEPKAPVQNFNIEFVLGEGDSAERRQISSQYKMRLGMELDLADGRWRVIRVEDGDAEGVAQYAYCIRVGGVIS